jgi:hypothetical protein
MAQIVTELVEIKKKENSETELLRSKKVQLKKEKAAQNTEKIQELETEIKELDELQKPIIQKYTNQCEAKINEHEEQIKILDSKLEYEAKNYINVVTNKDALLREIKTLYSKLVDAENKLHIRTTVTRSRLEEHF